MVEGPDVGYVGPWLPGVSVGRGNSKVRPVDPLIRVALLIGFLAPAVGRAHPFEDGLAGHRLRLTVRADSVEADLLIEEPVPWVLRDLRAFLRGVENPGPADQERYDARRLDEFETGLQLFVDGERTAWQRLPWDGENGVGDRQFVIYGLRLTAALDPARQDIAIHVLDANHPDARVARMTEVWGSWDTDLRGCSLWENAETDRSGKWVLVDGMSELRVTRRRTSWGSGRWSRMGMWWRTGSSGVVKVGPEGIAGPVPTEWGLAGLAVLGLLSVAGLGLKVRREREYRAER